MTHQYHLKKKKSPHIEIIGFAPMGTVNFINFGNLDVIVLFKSS